jgi:hypothetical protein
MSTHTNSLYRPIKIKDILDLGFEFHTETCIKIHQDKLTKHIEYEQAFNSLFGFNERIKEDYYYLHIYEIVNHRNNDCVWGFTRYGSNGAAFNCLVEGLHNLGYKLKIEGERYHHEYDMEKKQNILRQVVKLEN